MHSKDHAMAAPTSGRHAERATITTTALHHYRGLNCGRLTLPLDKNDIHISRAVALPDVCR
jgi:hypothetical protein